MRIRILSDLHLEFGELPLPDIAADLILFAGDIHTKLHGVRWMLGRFPATKMLYVGGNHEYYGENFPRLNDKILELIRGTGVHFLENEEVEIGGFRFFGATLWTDFSLFGDPFAGKIEALQMNDYKRIRLSPSFRKLRPSDTRVCHLKTVCALESFLKSGPAGRSVVLTHHAPSIRSLPEERRSELISSAYASDLEWLIERHEPLLWVHGHIHASQDYWIGRTRVISNPRGYPDKVNPGFDDRLVLDLEGR